MSHLQGPPKTIKPPFTPPGQSQPLVGHGPFQCGYCGRYGQPGACEGCGAPNAPAKAVQDVVRVQKAVEIGVLTPNEGRAMCGKPQVPAFDMVKR